ncbi:MAG: carbohydrate ABC transporter permease [Clostridiales bacterium]|mgnify:CR=1 FL=1|nr:carbohydrate ABC transporter permease [Clostridiales bacterium]
MTQRPLTARGDSGLREQRPFHARIPAFLYMLLCVLVALFPILWVVMSSFKSNAQILSSAVSLPTAYSFEGYRMALEVSPILRYFFNSVVITMLSTFLNVFLVSLAAYVFARTRFRGKNLLFSILALSMVIPMTALMQPVYQVITSLGLADSLPGLVLVYMALNMPLTLLIMRASFAGVPASLEEAAYIDGAGFMYTYFRVMLPLTKGGLASAAVMAFLNAWNEFTFALVLTKSAAVRTLPLSLSYFTSQFSFNYTALFAAITMAVLPSILIFAVFQEQVSQSLVIGAVKG